MGWVDADQTVGKVLVDLNTQRDFLDPDGAFVNEGSVEDLFEALRAYGERVMVIPHQHARTNWERHDAQLELSAVTDLKNSIFLKDTQLKEKDTEIDSKAQALQQRDAQIVAKEKQLEVKDGQISAKDAEMRKMEEKIKAFKP